MPPKKDAKKEQPKKPNLRDQQKKAQKAVEVGYFCL
jgi:hypothetical protein